MAIEIKRMNRLVKILLGLTAVVGLAAVYVLNPRLPSPEGEQSASLYQSDTLGVSRERIEWVDTARSTQANGDFEGSSTRELNGYIWYPETQDEKPFPLIVYSHGFMSSVAEPEYLVDFLVPKGYAVVAVDYPLSHGGAPGGPNANDVINQAGDVSFVINAMLARNADEADSLHGLLDPSRIAAVGLSLGGLTTQIAAYHRDARDPRIAAAVSIAGPSVSLERRFFQTADIPFMMIAGSADAIVPYEANAVPMLSKVDNSVLVTLNKASHTGFANTSTVLFRWFRHPDEIVCPMVLDGLEREGSGSERIPADTDVGISNAEVSPCTMENFERAMRPADQHMLTRLALYAFLEKVFARDADRRQQMDRYLAAGFAEENPTAAVKSNSERPTR